MQANTNVSIDTTPIGALTAEFVQRYWKFSPSSATYAGVAGFDHLLDEYAYQSPEYIAYLQEFVDRIVTTPLYSDAERIAATVFEYELRGEIEDSRYGYDHRAWGVIVSPAATIKELFDVMESDTAEQRSAIRSRIAQIPRALRQWREEITAAATDGHVNSRHATLETITQFRQFAQSAIYAGIIASLPEDGTEPGIDLTVVGALADEAHAVTATFLEKEYLPRTRDNLGVGREAYAQLAKGYTGCSIDLDAAHRSASLEIREIAEEMRQLATSIYPDAASVADALERLDSDPRHLITSHEELIAKITTLVDDATLALVDQFTVPEAIRVCEVRLDDDAMDAAPSYMGPSDDLVRPGAIIYPTMGATAWPLWRQVSTIYHEGVPGHHLQVATSTLQRDSLTQYQRMLSWNAGYGEGWALYAERLMDELGFFNEPAYRLGHLMDRAMRVARVVIDIGLHLGLPDPSGRPWTYDSAVNWFQSMTLLPRDYVESEINRYIAWPGQAISYKVGEQRWLDARAKALAAGISLPEFHKTMLEAGSMPLEVFVSYVDGYIERSKASKRAVPHVV